MKKIFFPFLALLLLVSSCKDSVSTFVIEKAVATLNSELPLSSGQYITMDSAVCNSNQKVVSLYYTVAFPESVELDMDKHINSLDEATIANVVSNGMRKDPKIVSIFDLMADQDFTLDLVYCGDGRIIRTFSISKDVYGHDLAESDVTNSEISHMRTEFANLKKQLPVRIDEVTILNDCNLDEEKKLVTYVYQLSLGENEYSEEELEEIVSLLRGNLLSVIAGPNMALYTKNNFSFNYQYFDSNNELLFEIPFTPEDYK
ncbi:MAG: hypothetical protein MJZ14_08580 [Paludibacteraceae bacterium]|nr:hypothetical protein [Paludibacteraceae bacterium]